MENGPQFAPGDFRRAKDCRDQITGLLANAIDVMVMRGWGRTEILEAVEAALKDQWKSTDADPEPEGSLAEVDNKPYPEAPLAG